jgi:hypothetical protein
LTYRLKHPSWYFDNSGNLLGTEIIRENITLSPDGTRFTGSFWIDVYDTQWNFLEQFTGNLKAWRITP